MRLQVPRRASTCVIEDMTGLAGDVTQSGNAAIRHPLLTAANAAAVSPVPDLGQHASRSPTLLNNMMEALSPIVELAALTPLPTSVEGQTAALNLPLTDHASGTLPSAGHSHLACLAI